MMDCQINFCILKQVIQSIWLNRIAMKKLTFAKRYIYFVLPVVLGMGMAMPGNINGQTNAVVLPSDGNHTKSVAPQGSLRYQRGFYLIKGNEIQASGLQSGDTVNCIGFTIADAQSDTTRGKFKVYLQNTTDTISRIDTAWTVITGITINSHLVTGLHPGNYEWQVRSNCSPFSPILNFNNDNLDSCRQPTHLKEENITDVSAKLSWVSPAHTVVDFFVEYSPTDTNDWIGVSTTNTDITITGLIPNKGYQWRVKTRCGTDSSEINNSSFETERTNNCNSPTAPTIVSVGDTTAKLAWGPAAGKTFYSIRFRRVGNSSWVETISFTDTLNINSGLVPGTTYEWQVRSNCNMADAGAYITGPRFTTTGPTACYFPPYFSADSITSSSVRFTWDSSIAATSYELRYRAKDIISWVNAITPMELVHDDSIAIPDTIGPYNILFEGPVIDTFVYTGQGVYVAWEYEQALGPLSSPNTSLATIAHSVLKGSYGQDSLRYILSFITRSDTSALALDTILNASDYRPETRLCSPSLKDSVEVLAVYALGKYAPRYTSAPVSAVIRNYTAVSKMYSVNMTVKEQITQAVRYTVNQNITVGPDTLGLIEFTGWSPALLETDSIIISVPAQANENVLNNNRNFYLQSVTPSTVSYEDGSSSIAQAGTDTLAGMTLSRHYMAGCGKINAVQVYLSQSAEGHSIYAVALDTNEVILGQSSPIIPDSNQVNKYYTFYLPGTRLLQNETYYVGLAQEASPVAYYPVGVQYEGGRIRDSAYFRNRITGDSLWHQPYPGRLMIRAELVPGTAVPSITGDLYLCTGTMDTLVASSIFARYADSVIAYSSQYSSYQYSAREALGSPNVFPAYNTDPNAWIPANESGRESLVLHFSDADSINFVDVFETFNPGALDSVYLQDEGTGLFQLIWSGTAAPAPQASRKNRISFPLTPYKVSGVRLSFNMDTVPGYSAIDAVCIGRLVTPGVFTSLTWTGGSTNDTLIISAPGIYKVTAVDAIGCMSVDSVTSISPVSVTPVITAVGPLSFCPGDSVKLKSSQTGGNTWSNGATTDSIYVKTAGSYTVTYNDGTGCGTTVSSPVNVTLFTPPTVNITGTLGICPGETTVLHAGLGFTGYLWSTNETGDSIEVDNPGLYIVVVTDANGCKGSDTVTTSYSPEPAPSITGTLIFCPGDSTLLDAGAGFSSYLWSTGATTSTINVSTAGGFSVTVTNSDGCIGSTTQFTSLYNSPFAVISGYDGFCPSDSVLLSGSGGQSYLWSTGSTNTTIYAAVAGVYVLTVTDANGCKDSVSKNIVQFTPPSPFISGTLSFCAGGSVTALDAGTDFNTYLWSTGETSSSILVSMVGSYSVTVTDNNGCEGSTSVTVTQEGGIPDIPGPITGSVFGMCNTLSPSTYSVSPVPNSTCYIWKVPPGAKIVSGFMADSNLFANIIQVVFDNSFTGGYIEVASHNDCGASPSFNGRRIYVSATPGSVPGNISGPTSGVCKLPSAIYSIPPVVGATSYYWSLPLGATILNGQGTPAIQVSFASSYRAGDICVQYNTLCGTSPFQCIAVKPVPETGGAITGPSVVCAFNQNIAYSIPLSAGANDYQWSVPTGASITSGLGTNSIQVRFGNISGLISVKATNDCGEGLFQFLLVNVATCNRVPQRPEIITRTKQTGFEIKIFPNPSDGLLNLEWQPEVDLLKEDFTLSIYDPLHQLVYTSKVTYSNLIKESLDLRHFSRGLYFLQIQNKAQNYTTKILLQ